jgi:large subunit ribosomal protein L17
MRHRKAGRKFGMDSSARKAMFRNMVTSLMAHGSIRTTEAKAKELRGYAERVITIGKKAPSTGDIDKLSGEEQRQARADRVAAIRRVKRWINNDDALGKVMGEYAERFRTRPGGYTRVVKLSRRRAGDNAPMAIIELVEALDASASNAAAAEE